MARGGFMVRGLNPMMLKAIIEKQMMESQRSLQPQGELMLVRRPQGRSGMKCKKFLIKNKSGRVIGKGEKCSSNLQNTNNRKVISKKHKRKSSSGTKVKRKSSTAKKVKRKSSTANKVKRKSSTAKKVKRKSSTAKKVKRKSSTTKKPKKIIKKKKSKKTKKK